MHRSLLELDQLDLLHFFSLVLGRCFSLSVLNPTTALSRYLLVRLPLVLEQELQHSVLLPKSKSLLS